MNEYDNDEWDIVYTNEEKIKMLEAEIKYLRDEVSRFKKILKIHNILTETNQKNNGYKSSNGF